MNSCKYLSVQFIDLIDWVVSRKIINCVFCKYINILFIDYCLYYTIVVINSINKTRILNTGAPHDQIRLNHEPNTGGSRVGIPRESI